MSDSIKREGLLKIFSLGKVAENKKLDSNTIQVTPLEALQLIDGELKSNPEEQEAEGTDAEGQQYTATATTDNAFEADWLPLDAGDRATAPDVRRGERVLIWQYGDSNEFFWTPLGLDNNLRRLETVSYMWSATKDEATEALDGDNSYVLTISTHEKAITLTTSKVNEEHTIWGLQLNTADGRLIFTEENGNEIEIDAKNTIINLMNADKTRLTLDKTNMYIYADDGLYVETGKSVEIVTKTMSVKCDSYTLQSKTTVMKSDSTTIQGSNVTIDAPTTTVTGSLKTGPNAEIGGLTISNGNINCTSLTASGRVKASNVD